MKKRLDVLLVERGFCASREKAKAYILAGEVFIGSERALKPGDMLSEDCVIDFRGAPPKYVSRGGYKLEKAMAEFGLGLDGCVCADIGASTGGFTDCMLQNGAQKVYSVDVGYGQLDWKLRSDPRVVCIERTNARYIDSRTIPEKLDFFSVDVSFISLKLILPAIRPLMSDNGRGVCLIKPQFEAGKDKVGDHGVVRDEATHREVIERVCGYIGANGLRLLGLTFSPIKGPEGNIEYLAYVGANGEESVQNVAELVSQAHKKLKASE